MKSAYRCIVWGPGTVGSAALREIIRKPELELVGVLAYNPEKNGKDAGEYLGMAPVGVKITTDQETGHHLRQQFCQLLLGFEGFQEPADWHRA